MKTINILRVLSALIICSGLSTFAYSQTFVAPPNLSVGMSGGMSGGVQPLQPSALPSNQIGTTTNRPVQPTAEQLNALPPETRAVYIAALEAAAQRQQASTERQGDLNKQVSELQQGSEGSKQQIGATQNPQVNQQVAGIQTPDMSQGKNLKASIDTASSSADLKPQDPKQNYGQANPLISGGIGGSIASSLGASADLHAAQKAQLEVQAKVAETGAQSANDKMQQMMDVIQDVRDKLQSVQQSEIEANRSIARPI